MDQVRADMFTISGLPGEVERTGFRLGATKMQTISSHLQWSLKPWTARFLLRKIYRLDTPNPDIKGLTRDIVRRGGNAKDCATSPHLP